MIDQTHALIAHLDIEHLLETGEVKWSLLHVDLEVGREGIAAVQAAQAYHKRPKFRRPIEGAQPCNETAAGPNACTTNQASTTGQPILTDANTAPSATETTPTAPPAGTGRVAPAVDRDALRARIGELVAAGHETLVRAAWPHGVAPLSKPGHTDDDLALILLAVRRVESDVSWPFRPEDTPPASPAVTDESPPRPAPQPPDEGGDVDPTTVAALQAAFAALPDAARQAIGVISAEANAAGRPISVTQSPTLRRWSIARALVAWASWSDGIVPEDADNFIWSVVGDILDSSQVTDDDTTLGALIGALTIAQANALHDTFDITEAA